IPEGVAMNGVLQATAGDFDGDGRRDLAIGEPSRVLTTGSGTILDQDEHGTVVVFLHVSDKGHILIMTQADATIRGDFEFDSLGVLSETPAVDLDQNGIDDLVIGAPGADVVTTEVISAGGRIFIVYGRPVNANLPANAQEIGNRSLTGGFFMVDNGT